MERMFRDLERQDMESRRQYYYLINSHEETLKELLSDKNWSNVTIEQAVTKSLIRRMINHFRIENDQKNKIGRLKLGVGVAGTYFEDILAVYLRSYLRSRVSAVEILLNKTLEKRTVPDITVTKSGKIAAFLELKSNFNWHRGDHWPDINRKYLVFRKYVGLHAIFVIVLSKAMLKDESLDRFKGGCQVEKSNICVLMEDHPSEATEEKVCEPIEPLLEKLHSILESTKWNEKEKEA